MSRRWATMSRSHYGSEVHLPDLGLRLKAGTRLHRKFVLREFKAARITGDFYQLAFADVDVPVHTAFEACQDDPEAAMALFVEHTDFLAWHMLMTNGIFDWSIVAHPPFAQRFPAVVAHVKAVPQP